VKNRYVNKDEEDESDSAAGAKRDAPPPTDAEFRQKMLLPSMPSATLAPAQNRGMFNRAKTRGTSFLFIFNFFSVTVWVQISLVADYSNHQLRFQHLLLGARAELKGNVVVGLRKIFIALARFM